MIFFDHPQNRDSLTFPKMLLTSLGEIVSDTAPICCAKSSRPINITRKSKKEKDIGF